MSSSWSSSILVSRSVRSVDLKIVKSLMFVILYGISFHTAINLFVECGVVFVASYVLRVIYRSVIVWSWCANVKCAL